ncbi:hypothetical protein BH18GEM1_BH18GEM1_14290 [soil metagenome]
MHRLLAVLIALDFTLAAGALQGQSAHERDPAPIPLDIGTTWVYKGTVWWTPRIGRAIYKERVTWAVEVADTIMRGNVRAAVLKGNPQDLAWLDRERLPSEYLLVQVGGTRLYLLGGERALQAERRLRDPRDALVELVRESELLLDLPLRPGKRFCGADQITRSDAYYCWVVESETPADLRPVRGAEAGGEHTLYTVTLRTAGEHHVWGFVPGVGFTSYAFGHHGTVAAVEVDLVELRVPAP